jgi:hypothetical protein
MFRIDSDSAVAVLPAPAAAGTQGYFTGGDPSSGIPPTTVTHDFLNIVQEELAAIPAAAGIPLLKTVRNQVLTALQALFAPLSAADFSSGSNANGYWQKLPDGMIEQWGEVVAGESSSPPSLDFPIPFTDLNSVNLQVTARTPNNAATNGNRVGGNKVSLTQFNVFCDDFDEPVFWRAKGR